MDDFRIFVFKKNHGVPFISGRVFGTDMGTVKGLSHGYKRRAD